jgi:hypothetical protein
MGGSVSAKIPADLSDFERLLGAIREAGAVPERAIDPLYPVLLSYVRSRSSVPDHDLANVRFLLQYLRSQIPELSPRTIEFLAAFVRCPISRQCAADLFALVEGCFVCVNGVSAEPFVAAFFASDRFNDIIDLNILRVFNMFAAPAPVNLCRSLVGTLLSQAPKLRSLRSPDTISAFCGFFGGSDGEKATLGFRFLSVLLPDADVRHFETVLRVLLRNWTPENSDHVVAILTRPAYFKHGAALVQAASGSEALVLNALTLCQKIVNIDLLSRNGVTPEALLANLGQIADILKRSCLQMDDALRKFFEIVVACVADFGIRSTDFCRSLVPLMTVSLVLNNFNAVHMVFNVVDSFHFVADCFQSIASKIRFTEFMECIAKVPLFTETAIAVCTRGKADYLLGLFARADLPQATIEKLIVSERSLCFLLANCETVSQVRTIVIAALSLGTFEPKALTVVVGSALKFLPIDDVLIDAIADSESLNDLRFLIIGNETFEQKCVDKFVKEPTFALAAAILRLQRDFPDRNVVVDWTKFGFTLQELFTLLLVYPENEHFFLGFLSLVSDISDFLDVFHVVNVAQSMELLSAAVLKTTKSLMPICLQFRIQPLSPPPGPALHRLPALYRYAPSGDRRD